MTTKGKADASGPFDIREAFAHTSAGMRARMEATTKLTTHGPTIGDGAEVPWRNMLEDFLPKRYAVSKAFVVDSNGCQSEQLDIVIHDRHFTPLLWEIDGALFIPAESVYAAFEVKQDLSAKHVKAAGKKVGSVRALYRTSGPVVHAAGRVDTPKDPPRILGGLLAGRSTWRPPFGKPLRSALDGLGPSQTLDLGCALEHGAFELPEGSAAKDALTVVDDQVGLAFLAFRLLARLQEMGSVPAVDIDAYTRVLSS